MTHKLKYEAAIDVIGKRPLNPEFSLASCRVMYTGKNRNRSNMSKQAADKALQSIYNVPVVAEVLHREGDDKDFGSHGGKIIIDSTGVKYEQTTVPYGVVPESANPRWINYNGKEYLECDVILWTGRYEDLNILVEDVNKKRPHSMEITVNSSEIGNDGYEYVSDFSFSALTILGSEVEPCFEDSAVSLYSNNNFNSRFEEMMNAYSKINKNGGAEHMDENAGNVEVTAEPETKIDIEVVEVVDTKEDFELAIVDIVKEEVVEVVETVTINASDYAAEKAGYALTISSLNTKVEELEKSVAAFEKASVELNGELTELKSYKLSIETAINKNAIDEVLEMFEARLSELLDFTELKENAYNMTKEDVETKCYIMVGKMNFKVTSKKENIKKAFSVINVNSDSEIDAKLNILDAYKV